MAILLQIGRIPRKPALTESRAIGRPYIHPSHPAEPRKRRRFRTNHHRRELMGGGPVIPLWNDRSKTTASEYPPSSAPAARRAFSGAAFPETAGI